MSNLDRDLERVMFGVPDVAEGAEGDGEVGRP